MDNSPVELELDTSPVYDAPMIAAAKRFAEQMSAYGPHGGIIAAGGWAAPTDEHYTLNGDVDLWVRAHKKQRKRAEKAEKKLKRLRKLRDHYGDKTMTNDGYVLWVDLNEVLGD